jgi:DNA-binding GntR family transcriptional regulator
MGFSPVERETVQNRVHAELRAALMLGRLDPGQVLTIQSVADTFATSTLPAREALSRLVAERGLELTAGRSVRVPELSRERLFDIERARKLIEGEAAAIACRLLPADLPDRLAQLVQAQHVCAANNGVYLALEANQAFHFTLYQASASPALVQAIESLWLQFGPYQRALVGRLPRDFGPGTEHHHEIIAALRARDPEATRAAVVRDVDRVCRLLDRSDLLGSDAA